jgi:hypothetical protein
MILWALVIEHVLSFSIEWFRKYEIERSGILDINGVPRGKYESMLGTF